MDPLLDLKPSSGNDKIDLERVPCELLYNSINIDYKGDVSLCCLDVFIEEKMGNVFDKGVKNVWLGEAFNKARSDHESGNFNSIKMCRKCDQWANYKFDEKKKDNYFIRESAIMTFYNRMDRLNNWETFR